MIIGIESSVHEIFFTDFQIVALKFCTGTEVELSMKKLDFEFSKKKLLLLTTNFNSVKTV